MEKKLYSVYHECDFEDERGYPDRYRKFVGVIRATDEELKKFLAEWDRNDIYDSCGGDEYRCHIVTVEAITIADADEFQPYSTSYDDNFNRRIRMQKERASE